MKIQFLALLTLLPALLIGQSIDSGGIQKIIDKSIDNEYIFGVSLSVSYKDEIQHFASGASTTGEPYFLASLTKLYTSAVLFKLIDQGKISLDDPISQYLDESVLQGLHVYEGKDYSDDLRIRHLVSHTSGLSDYFEQTNKAFQPIAMMLTNHIKKLQKEGAFNASADLEVALPLLYGQFVFLFNHDTGHRFLFGRDIHDKGHAERVKKEFIRIVMLALGHEN